jgi:hypothetical protein
MHRSSRGQAHHHQTRRVEWREVFHQLGHGSPPPTIAEVADAWGACRETVRRRWRMYQRGVAEDDSSLIEVACGDVDGRRDNHRVFSREEEALLRSAIDQENIDPNTYDIQRLALQVHKQHEEESSSSSTSKPSSTSTPTFSASMGFVERVKRDLHLSAQKPRFERKNKRIKGPEVEEKRELEAIEFIDDVHRSVLRNGARLVINADETSCKFIHLPHTLFAPVGGEHPPVIHSNHTNKEAFSMIFATTASGAKLKPAVIISPRGERAMRAFAHLTSRVHIFQAHRWFGYDTWCRYIEEVIKPFCDGHPATFVFDSSNVHLHDVCVDTAMEHDVYSVVVPKGETGVLQPNDVHVFGPLKALAGGVWRKQMREEPESYDSLAVALERHLDCWDRLTRETVIHAWKDANPLLRGLRNWPGTASV